MAQAFAYTEDKGTHNTAINIYIYIYEEVFKMVREKNIEVFFYRFLKGFRTFIQTCDFKTWFVLLNILSSIENCVYGPFTSMFRALKF